jgi:transcriptional regulator with XRE-family HTH domain
MLHLLDNIKYVRELTGMSRTEFGEVFGLTKDQIQSYEVGRAKPAAQLINELAAMFEITPEKFGAVNLRTSIKDVGIIEIVKKIKAKAATVIGGSSKENPTQAELVKALREIQQLSLSVATAQMQSTIDNHEKAELKRLLDLSLGELRHNILLTRAISETTQEMIAAFQAGKNKKMYAEILDNASIANVEKYKKLKEEGNFSYVGK